MPPLVPTLRRTLRFGAAIVLALLAVACLAQYQEAEERADLDERISELEQRAQDSPAAATIADVGQPSSVTTTAAPIATPASAARPPVECAVRIRRLVSAVEPTAENGVVPGLFEGEFTVKVGATVTWTQDEDEPHTATALNGCWDTGVIYEGESVSITFDRPGHYAFYCQIHSELIGALTVGE